MKRDISIALLAFGEVVLLLVLLADHFALRSRLELLRQHQSDVTAQNQLQLPLDAQESVRRLETRNGTIQAVSAVAVAVFTGALLLFSFLGWRVATKSADAAKSSADTAIAAGAHQQLVSMLSTRAYVAVNFVDAIFQDAQHLFEGIVEIVNRGSTPAYEVSVTAIARIVASPIPDDFDFSLAAAQTTTSVSLLGPGLSKTVRRWVSEKVPDADVHQIQLGGPPRCLLMYGTVNYKDAFGIARYTHFSAVLMWHFWLPGKDTDKDGNPLPPRKISSDTKGFNDAN